MKTDRLYAITVYLLNHGKTSAAQLAQKFEVSVRTVQRDIDSLCQAGIPVIAETGAAGGYYLADTFRMDAQTATKEDYSLMLTALKGFLSAMDHPGLTAAVEKISALVPDQKEGIILDFSTLREGDNELLVLLRAAIRQKHPVSFDYTNAENSSRIHTVEPIAVVYRWYAWYLLAYSIANNDYRTYKLVRMRNAKIVEVPFTKEHADAETILQSQNQKSPQQCTEIHIRCKSEARAKAAEYLNGVITHEYENGDCDMTLHVIENEQFWFGMVLSLTDGIEILEPERIRRRVLETAEKITDLYSKMDS